MAAEEYQNVYTLRKANAQRNNSGKAPWALENEPEHVTNASSGGAFKSNVPWATEENATPVVASKTQSQAVPWAVDEASSSFVAPASYGKGGASSSIAAGQKAPQKGAPSQQPGGVPWATEDE